MNAKFENAKNFLEKNIIAAALLAAVAFRILQSVPLDGDILPGGTDTYSHLFRAWYATEAGGSWNYFWWGGTTFIRYYSPLSYIVSGYLGQIIGWLLAYKILLDAVFILTPVAFYYLLKEFGLDRRIIALAVFIFSLSPIFLYTLFDGRYPSLFSVFFVLLYWKFLKRSIDNKDGKWRTWALASGILLGIAIPMHLLVSGYAIIITFVWVIAYSFKPRTLLKFGSTLFAALLAGAWFLAPLFLETGGFSSEGTSPANLFGQASVSNAAFVLKMPFLWIYEFYSSPLAPIIISVSTFFLLFLALLPIKNINKDTRALLAVFLLIGIMSVFTWRRILMLMPVPLSMLAAYAVLSIRNKRFRHILASAAIILTVAAFFSLAQNELSVPKFEKFSDGRVMFMPFNNVYSLLIAPLNGNEIIDGWWTIGEVSPKRYEYFPSDNVSYTELLNNMSVDAGEQYGLLRDGYVNYVFIDKSYPKIVEHFNTSDFTIGNYNEKFWLLEPKEKFSYIEINGEPARSLNVSKAKDRVAASFECKSGRFDIKESWHEFWSATLNGKLLNLQKTKYDFIAADINASGACTLIMEFREPAYYLIFRLLWLIPIALLALAVLNNPKPKKQIKVVS